MIQEINIPAIYRQWLSWYMLDDSDATMSITNSKLTNNTLG